ncbi:polysaccharide biosynthesis/export family protein [Acidipila sp. EB88]|uniref:polysaccharide biosynthesis/export family protein n=1 Tax=Acidipila sp. EB88 TaxID=2305226 RepID=UPI0013157A79|nr:polysaccharide biosynthesis/export family protein [Acidipila sp. EB88]
MLNSKRLRTATLALMVGTLSVASLYAQVPAAATPLQGSAMGSDAQMGSADGAPSIMIGPGDLLNVAVFETPEVSTSVRVNQNGEANLPILGPLHLAGQTTSQASAMIEDAYRTRGLLLNPHVTVSETEFASQGASILGEIRQPGVYPTLGSRRLLDMISLAGGVAPTAGRLVSIVHRNDPQHPVQIALQPTPASVHAQENPVILPGDTVIVAKAGVIYVLGDVLRPGGILVDNNERLSIIEALSLAGGMNKTAALSKTKLVRKLPAGREEVDLDLKHILYGKQADVLVSDGDILYVPSSLGKTILYRGIEGAFTLAASGVIFTR